MCAASDVNENLLKTYIDWSQYTVVDDHLWEKRKGKSMKCRICNLNCESTAANDNQYPACKPSCVEHSDDPESDSQVTRHYFVPSTSKNAFCVICSNSNNNNTNSNNKTGKELKHRRQTSFLSNLTNMSEDTYQSKQFVQCAWCLRVCHSHTDCFSKFSDTAEISSQCDFGILSAHIIPPSMIHFNRHGFGDTNGLDSGRVKKNAFFRLNVPEHLPENFSPILVFINLKSGSQKSRCLYNTFLQHLNPRQVFILPEDNPTEVLNFFRALPRLTLIVCGGDGSISWISAVLTELDMTKQCQVCPMPLGTGNDFSQSFNWGKVLVSASRFNFLKQVQRMSVARHCSVDLWSIKMKLHGDAAQNVYLRNPTFINYFSIGADAKIALNFHEDRNKHPERFTNRTFNLMNYFSSGLNYFFNQKYRNFHTRVKLFCDHEDLTERIKSLNIQILLILNIKSYASSLNPWVTSGTGDFQTQAFDDGLIEVIGFSISSLPSLVVNLGGHKIAQCRHVKIVTSQPCHMQMDGEPTLVPEAEITIEKCDQVSILMRNKNLRVMASHSDADASTTTNFTDMGEASKNVKGSQTDMSGNEVSDTLTQKQDDDPLTEVNSSPTLNMSYLFNLFKDQDTIQSIIKRYFTKDWKAEQSLVEAVKNGDHRTILYLINNVRNINLDCRDQQGNTPLHYAAKTLDVYCLSLLLINGANPYIKNSAGDTAVRLIKNQPRSGKILNFIKRVIS